MLMLARMSQLFPAAWRLAQELDIVPIARTRRPEIVEENAAAAPTSRSVTWRR